MKDSDFTRDITAIIGNRIREARKQSGLSQGQLADMVGLNRSHISNIETGHSHVTVIALSKIASGLGTTLSRLLADAEIEALPDTPEGRRLAERIPRFNYEAVPMDPEQEIRRWRH